MRSTSGGTREVEGAPGRAARAARGRLAWIGGTLLAAVVLMFCYLRISGTTQVNSDGAGMIWEASSILHGNVLLHGWWATDVSFYTTELPEYVGVTAFAGLRPEVVHICSALTYTLLVLLAAFVARGRARGAEGLIRAALAAGVMLAPQPTGPTQVLLGSPDHVGTAVPVLALLLLLDWAPARWYVAAGAGILLAAAIVGDPLIEVIGVLPLFLGGLIRAGRILWQRRADAPTASSGRSRLVGWAWGAAWYELSLAAAAALAVPVAWLAYRVIQHLGGYRTAKAFYGLQSAHEIIRGVPLALRSVLALYGADYRSVTGASNVAFALVHLIGVAVFLAAVVLAAWRLVVPGARLVPWQFRGVSRSDGAVAGGAGDLVADFLVIAITANFAAFLIEVPMENIYSAHEIGPVLSFGAALAGRVIGSLVAARLGDRAQAPAGYGAAALPGAAAQRTPPRSRPRRVLLGVFAAGLACYAVMVGLAAAHKQVAPRNVGLTQWLAGHHLTSGLAPYWEASSVTVDSGGKITVLGVQPTPYTNRLEPEHWETDVSLASAKGRTADFVIISPAENVHSKYVIDTFGRPAETFSFHFLTIMVWHKNLLPYLVTAPTAPARPGITTAWDPAGTTGRPAARG